MFKETGWTLTIVVDGIRFCGDEVIRKWPISDCVTVRVTEHFPFDGMSWRSPYVTLAGKYVVERRKKEQ